MRMQNKTDINIKNSLYLYNCLFCKSNNTIIKTVFKVIHNNIQVLSNGTLNVL